MARETKPGAGKENELSAVMYLYARRSRRRKATERLKITQRLLLYIFCAGMLLFVQGATRPAGRSLSAASAPFHIEPPFHTGQELTDLETALKAQSDKPRLRTGCFVLEMQTGRFADLHGHETFAAASMIKLPVLIALLIAVDNKQVKMDQILTLRPDLIAGGSGFLQWRPKGSKISLKQASKLMIINSDNTATNLIIDLLGGTAALNKQFAAWGLVRTRLSELLPDFPGLNKTSPYELAYLLGLVDQGQLLSADSRRFMLQIMGKTRTRTLLPPGLGAGAKIAHKTGDIGSMVGDAGLVTASDGTKYLIVAQVERPHNDRRANELVRRLSATVYTALVASGR